MEVSNLVVRYGRTVAVSDASFAAPTGEVTALIGANGAGKTTTVETCEGYVRPSGGSVRVLGLDPTSDATALRPRMGVMLQDGGVPSGARSLEVLRHMSRLYANPLDPVTLANRLGIADVRANYRRMSGGEQQRLKFAIALIGRPEIVFLDEPTAGLDATAKRVVWELVEQLRQAGVTVLLTTHLMDDVERLADNIVVMDRGSVVATGTPAELLRSHHQSLVFDAAPGLDLAALATTLGGGVAVSETNRGTYQVSGDVSPDSLAIVAAWCAEQGFMPRGLTTGQRRLEDVVLELTNAGAEVDR